MITIEELRGLPVKRLMHGQKRAVLRGVTIREEDFERAKKRERQREATRRWLAKPGNAEKNRQSKIAWREKNLERHKAAQRAWAQRNKAHVLAKSRMHKAKYVRDPEKRAKINAINREYYERNRAAIRERQNRRRREIAAARKATT